jgi:hypothetical protein
MDILYLQVALMTGLYVSLTVYKTAMATGGPAMAGAGATAPARRGPGWRVRESMQREADRRTALRLPALARR